MLLTGLIGWPLGHSRSPTMHNAAYAAARLDGVYVAMPVRPEGVAEAVSGLAALGFRGCNVTIPHKQAVIPLLDELSATAQAIGAVNTIVIAENGRTYGDNTDAPGFLAALREHQIQVEELEEGGALLLGAGGSARAVAYALASSRVPVTVLARRPEQAAALVQALRKHLPTGVILEARAWEALADLAAAHRLIVNCTPVGMHPHVSASPWPEQLAIAPQQIFYDLVYNPLQTRFMQQAQAAGARAFNGLGMLIHQGALSWQMWTGQPASIPAMRAALT